MSDLLPLIRQYIQTHQLIAPNAKVLVALSGGKDSMTLLDLLHRLSPKWPFDLHIAHLNHHLRPNAEADAHFVHHVAQSHNLPITIGNSDVATRAKSEKRSLEAAARAARRHFLTQTAHEIGADVIALGHTRSDQAETMLFRLMRGTGLTGLGGIRPQMDPNWIRPLLDMSRSQIEDYVQHRDLAFCTDETNSDLRFARNSIRHQLLPYIKTRFSPQIEPILTRTANLLQQDDDLLEKLAQEAFSKTLRYCANRKIILDVKRIFGYHISLRRRLIRIALFKQGIPENIASYDLVDRVLKALEKHTAFVQITADLLAHHTHNLLILARPTPAFDMPICREGNTEIPYQNAHVSASLLDATCFTRIVSNNPDTAFFDVDQLPDMLHIRTVEPGDRLCPFGLPGSCKISKLLIDNHIPRTLRDEVSLLTGKGQILWVLGLRRSQTAPITPNTRRILKLVFESGWHRIFTHPETR